VANPKDLLHLSKAKSETKKRPGGNAAGAAGDDGEEYDEDDDKCNSPHIRIFHPLSGAACRSEAALSNTMHTLSDLI
jgi:hypothetical protein